MNAATSMSAHECHQNLHTDISVMSLPWHHMWKSTRLSPSSFFTGVWGKSPGMRPPVLSISSKPCMESHKEPVMKGKSRLQMFAYIVCHTHTRTKLYVYTHNVPHPHNAPHPFFICASTSATTMLPTACHAHSHTLLHMYGGWFGHLLAIMTHLCKVHRSQHIPLQETLLS